jgi:hypothetical protein
MNVQQLSEICKTMVDSGLGDSCVRLCSSPRDEYPSYPEAQGKVNNLLMNTGNYEAMLIISPLSYYE